MIFEGTKKSIFFGLGLTRAGKPVSSGTLDGITRESVEANLKKSGSSLAQVSVDTRI